MGTTLDRLGGESAHTWEDEANTEAMKGLIKTYVACYRGSVQSAERVDGGCAGQ